MSAVSLWEVVVDPPYAGPNRTILAAMNAVRAATARIRKVAITMDNAAIGAIQDYYSNESMTHLATVAAEEAWNAFPEEYDTIITALSTVSSAALDAYGTASAPKTEHDKLCPLPTTLDKWLGKVDDAAKAIHTLTMNATADSGAQLGVAALEIASLAHQDIIWKLGWHWPAIWSNNWPKTPANVFHVDVNAGTPDYISILAKAGNDGAAEVADWWKFSVASYAPDGSWGIPSDMAVGDRLLLINASFNLDTSGNADPGYHYVLVQRALYMQVLEFSSNSAYVSLESGAQFADDSWTGIEVPDPLDANWPQIPMSQFFMRRVRLA